MKRKSGQILVGALLLMAVLAIIIPVMLGYIKNETRWSMKQGQNSNAFQLAEAALDRGYQKATESTATWKTIQDGDPISGFAMDTPYSDLPGGSYAVSVTSGSDIGTVVITGVGRDRNLKETRALKALYANAVMGDISIIAAKGVAITGNNIKVEWGAVSSPKTVDTGGKTHPSFWSAANIMSNGTSLDSNSAPPNCDTPNCWWWHSYYTQLPPFPPVNTEGYKQQAILDGTDPCGNAYYQPGDYAGNCNSLNGKTYYIEGNWTGFRSAIVGNLIVMGNLEFKNGSQMTVGSYAAKVPPTAWKQYCNDWAAYQAYDSNAAGKPACFGSLSSSYRATGVTSVIDPAIHGFVYIGKDLVLPNGGGSDDLVHGAIVVKGLANITSNSQCRIYYDADIAMNIQTTKISLVRQSWQDVIMDWPLP